MHEQFVNNLSFSIPHYLNFNNKQKRSNFWCHVWFVGWNFWRCTRRASWGNNASTTQVCCESNFTENTEKDSTLHTCEPILIHKNKKMFISIFFLGGGHAWKNFGIITAIFGASEYLVSHHRAKRDLLNSFSSGTYNNKSFNPHWKDCFPFKKKERKKSNTKPPKIKLKTFCIRCNNGRYCRNGFRNSIETDYHMYAMG